MDRFDLKWPETDATFYTDGWRCRIVWRQKGGMGGTIDNNVQCVQRVAQSVPGAPYLLGALKARGHERLATQIETLVAEQVPADQGSGGRPESVRRPVAKLSRRALSPEERAGRSRSAPEQSNDQNQTSSAAVESAGMATVNSEKTAAKSDLAVWQQRLDQETGFEAVENRRAKAWVELGTLRTEEGEETLLLKVPSPRGKPEWVLKRTWVGEKRKTEYVAAARFAGIAAYLVEVGADAVFIGALLKALADSSHEEIEQASAAWQVTG